MNAASRVIDGAAEGKDGKRHELRASSFELRRTGSPAFTSCTFNEESRSGCAFARTTPEEAAENSFSASATWRCTRRPRRPRLGGRAPARRQLASRELPPLCD